MIYCNLFYLLSIDLLCFSHQSVELVAILRSVYSLQLVDFVHFVEYCWEFEHMPDWLLLEKHIQVEVVAIYLKMLYSNDLGCFSSGCLCFRSRIYSLYQRTHAP